LKKVTTVVGELGRGCLIWEAKLGKQKKEGTGVPSYMNKSTRFGLNGGRQQKIKPRGGNKTGHLGGTSQMKKNLPKQPKKEGKSKIND